MQLVNEFVVPRPIDEAWAVLTDVPRIAPCMPGATLGAESDGVYQGTVKIKVGPVTAAYGGTATFRERDAEAHHMVLDASGKESSGRGRASAVVTADLTAEGDETRVRVVTDLTISGPLAQFGRGAIAEVSTRLLNQFVDCLRDTVLNSAPAAGPGAEDAADHELVSGPYAAEVPVLPTVAGPSNPVSAPSPVLGLAPSAAAHVVRTAAVPAPAAEVNLLRVAAWPVLKRLVPALIVLAAIVVLLVWWLG